jgi:hypothetical protein
MVLISLSHFWQYFTITNLLVHLAEFAYATVLYLTLPDDIPELDILYKINKF